MGYLSHRVDPDEIKPGDHIYTWRTAFTYAHHGIYVGGYKVIHFTSDQENAKSKSGWNLSSSLPIPSSCLNSTDSGISLHETGHNCGSNSCFLTYVCGYHQPDSGVTLSCLNCFIGTGSLYLYQYGTNICMHFSRLRGGTCTTKPSDPPQDVTDRAIRLLGKQKGFGEYNVVRNNCENFALYCKTGLLIHGKPPTGGSGQVNSFINIPWNTGGVHMLQKVVFSNAMSPLTVAAGVAWNNWDRYKTDIGVRGDVVEVEVEDVESFMISRGY